MQKTIILYRSSTIAQNRLTLLYTPLPQLTLCASSLEQEWVAVSQTSGVESSSISSSCVWESPPPGDREDEVGAYQCELYNIDSENFTSDSLSC